MKVLLIDLAHHHKLNPDQLVCFARRYRNKYDIFDDDTDNPIYTAKTDTWNADELIKDFKHANRKGHDWREDLPENKNKTMKKKMVKESLNEGFQGDGDESDDLSGFRGGITKLNFQYKLENAKKTCEEIIKDAEETLEIPTKPYDDSSHIDAQARKEVAEQILSILK
jgi:hypothetical protein